MPAGRRWPHTKGGEVEVAGARDEVPTGDAGREARVIAQAIRVLASTL